MIIRDKLLGLKKRLSKVRMYSVVISIIAVTAIAGIAQYRNAVSYKQKLENNYNRAFYDLLGYVTNVNSYLVKAMMTTTPEKTSNMLQEAWREANMAQNTLGQLPIEQESLANTSRFLTQVGDIAYAYNISNLAGRRLTNEEFSNIEQLYSSSLQLDNALSDLHADLTEGRIKWGELTRKGSEQFASESDREAGVPAMENIQKIFKDYPKMIYDGPFSDHISELTPKGLAGVEISADDAKNTVFNVFGRDRVKSIEFNSENSSHGIIAYYYEVVLNESPRDSSISVAITKTGGHLLWMLYDKPEESLNISTEQAIKKASSFLASLGLSSMIDTYTLTEGNIITINYAHNMNGIVVYSDLIKVKVSMADSEIIGFEAMNYYFSHNTRPIPSPAISVQEAMGSVTPRMQISSVGLAIIPTRFKTEVLCYEFKGKFMDNDFIVYINSETGIEQDIIMIVNTPGGVLTM